MFVCFVKHFFVKHVLFDFVGCVAFAYDFVGIMYVFTGVSFNSMAVLPGMPHPATAGPELDEPHASKTFGKRKPNHNEMATDSGDVK